MTSPDKGQPNTQARDTEAWLDAISVNPAARLMHRTPQIEADNESKQNNLQIAPMLH